MRPHSTTSRGLYAVVESRSAVALVDVASIVENETYAGGNVFAYTVGWALSVPILLLLDSCVPRVLRAVNGSAKAVLIALVVFEIVNVAIQVSTP